MISTAILILVGCIFAVVVSAFVAPESRILHRGSPSSLPPAPKPVELFSTRNADEVEVDVDGWRYLTEDGGVKMWSNDSSKDLKYPTVGKDDVTVEYVGSYAERNWTIEDVNTCWLPDQGLTELAPKLFIAFNINGTKLMDEKKFTKKFIFEGLGVTKECKNNNLLCAAQELKESEITHPAGTVFDKNRFTFRLGKGMAIKAFDLALREMKPGDTATVLARCDYAYGRNGLRSEGKYLVPPYATVAYDLTLVEIK